MILLGFTRICREIVDVAIYALYPESFFGENLAIRKVFAFSDSGLLARKVMFLQADWMNAQTRLSTFTLRAVIISHICYLYHLWDR